MEKVTVWVDAGDYRPTISTTSSFYAREIVLPKEVADAALEYFSKLPEFERWLVELYYRTGNAVTPLWLEKAIDADQEAELDPSPNKPVIAQASSTPLQNKRKRKE